MGWMELQAHRISLHAVSLLSVLTLAVQTPFAINKIFLWNQFI